MNILKKQQKNYPSKTMEGNRALFLSKLLVLLMKKINSQIREKLILNYKNRKKEKIKNILSQQHEKFVLNDLFSLTDRHSGKGMLMNYLRFFLFFYLSGNFKIKRIWLQKK